MGRVVAWLRKEWRLALFGAFVAAFLASVASSRESMTPSVGIWSVALFALYGALWRRMLGGWLGARRPFVFAFAPLLCAPTWAVFPWWAALLVTALVTVFWAPGHDWNSLPALLKRYGLIGLCWWWAKKWWPESWRLGGFIDGPFAVAELSAGAVVYGLLAWGAVQ